MYRERLEELRKEKGFSYKKWAEESGVSVDTLDRIVHPENPEKDSPRVNTLEQAIKPFGVELWEIFYMGSTSLVSLQNEINTLRTERDSLLVENGALKDKVETLTARMDVLKDQMIEVLIGGKKC
jgi:transcriptional regulator with XRE-family HTH domain